MWAPEELHIKHPFPPILPTAGAKQSGGPPVVAAAMRTNYPPPSPQMVDPTGTPSPSGSSCIPLLILLLSQARSSSTAR